MNLKTFGGTHYLTQPCLRDAQGCDLLCVDLNLTRTEFQSRSVRNSRRNRRTLKAPDAADSFPPRPDHQSMAAAVELPQAP